MIRGLDRLGRERHSRGILIAGKPSPRLHGRKEHAPFGRRRAFEKWVIQDDDPPNEPERGRPRRHGRKYPSVAGRSSAKIGRRRSPARSLRLGKRADPAL